MLSVNNRLCLVLVSTLSISVHLWVNAIDEYACMSLVDGCNVCNSSDGLIFNYVFSGLSLTSS